MRYECMDSEHHEGGYASISGFQSGVPVDGVYEITVYAHAVNREHPYDPAILEPTHVNRFALALFPGMRQSALCIIPNRCNLSWRKP